MSEHKFSVGDRVQVSATYERYPHFRGVVGTIVKSPPSPSPLREPPPGYLWLKFDEPVWNPNYDQFTTGCAVPITEMTLLSPDFGPPPTV
jgi:hypothetical protein